MFEEYQEAALKEGQRKKIKIIINVATGILFSVMMVLLAYF